MKKSLPVLLAVLAVPALGAELTVSDFKLDGELGSQGAKLEKIGANHFKMTLGHAPGHPKWANHCQFQILKNAKGNAPRIDIEFSCPLEGRYEYGFSGNDSWWSYDGEEWTRLYIRSSTATEANLYVQRATITFPTLEKDTLFFGFNVPFLHTKHLELIEKWKKSPYVKVHVLGKSLGGRDLFRIEVTDPNSPVPAAKKWAHYAACQHPGECNAMWRIVGMIEWLLSDEGADARKHTIWHFVPVMSPDGVAGGWHRTNAQGIDMNRSYYIGGAAKEQGHEPYIFQKDMEAIMASECPLTTVWSMHVGGGSGCRPGHDEYLDNTIGPLDKLGQAIRKLDPDYKYLERGLTDANRAGSIKRPPGDKRPKDFKWDPSKSTGKGPQRGDTWSGGPWTQFRNTTFIIECGASSPKKESMTTGEIIIKAVSEYYKGDRPPFPQ